MKLTGKAKQEFLRKMAAGRRRAAKRARPAKHKRHHPAKHKRHHHQHSETPMAKKRRRKGHRKSHSTHKHKRGRGGGAKGLLRGLVPTVDEAISAGAAGAYGFLEGAAAKDKEHFLMKVPVPIASIGRCGTVGLGLWIIGAVAKRRFLRSMARGVVDVASYQLLRRGSPFGKGGAKDVEFTLSGPGSAGCDRRTPLMIDRHLQAIDRDDDGDDGDDGDDDNE